MQYLDKTKGAARQGDVLIWSLPDGRWPQRNKPLPARDGRFILVEAEATGHHHSIGMRLPQPMLFRDEASGYSEAVQCVGVAAVYEDAQLTQELVSQGYLTTARLCVGYLVVEGGPVVVEHQEHDAISVPVGVYYVGCQQEFNAGEMRRVLD